MKINSINNLNAFSTQSKSQTFGKTAVPYPEYKNAYIYSSTQSAGVIDRISEKISKLFQPEVSNEASRIKSQINTVFEDTASKKSQLCFYA
ncbi:hypothetical protein IJD44_09610 [bacterium]|nr:hypothetical protein [bacterium]